MRFDVSLRSDLDFSVNDMLLLIHTLKGCGNESTDCGSLDLFPSPSFLHLSWGQSRQRLLIWERCYSVEVCSGLRGVVLIVNVCLLLEVFCLLSDKHLMCRTHVQWLLTGIRLEEGMSALLNIARSLLSLL